MNGVRPLSDAATVELRGVTLGTGIPAVCVPLVAPDAVALQRSVASLPPGLFDVVELRADHLREVEDTRSLTTAIASVRQGLPEQVPLIFTFRSAREGGARAVDAAAYESLIACAVESGNIDAVDVELFTDDLVRDRIVERAHAAGIPVVMSAHDFDGTPPSATILERLVAQQAAGADIVKVAVMPHDPADVVALLAATVDYRATDAPRPAVTMSMGRLGVVSRVAGETFGSCLTFGAVDELSAPGQLDVRQLRAAMDSLHGDF